MDLHTFCDFHIRRVISETCKYEYFMAFNRTHLLYFKEYAIKSSRSLIHSVWVDIRRIIFSNHSVVAGCGAGYWDLVQLLFMHFQCLPVIAAL